MCSGKLIKNGGVFMTETAPPTYIEEREAVRIAELFGALSDPTRVKIVASLLHGPMNVQALAALVGISESGVSHQLRSLRQMRLVSARKDGRQVFYTLDDEHVAELFIRARDHVVHE
jgi:ArsR family transcriptional regulator, lead/cadmium/zinc/bismuth-responsive transcriptional repressor